VFQTDDGPRKPGRPRWRSTSAVSGRPHMFTTLASSSWMMNGRSRCA